MCTTRPCRVLQPLILGRDTKAFAGQGCFSPCLLYLFSLFPHSLFLQLCHPVAMFGIKGKNKPKRPPGTEVPPSPALPRQGSGHANMSQQSWNTATTGTSSSSMPTSSLPQASPSYMLDSYYQGKYYHFPFVGKYLSNVLSTGDNISIASSRSSSRTGSLSVGDDAGRFNGMSEKQVEDLFEKMLVRFDTKRNDGSMLIDFIKDTTRYPRSKRTQCHACISNREKVAHGVSRHASRVLFTSTIHVNKQEKQQ